MGSPLDLINTEGFRKKLITRNLTPYAKSPNRATLPINTEYIQSDTSVQDSPDQLIDQPTFANKLYPLNQYGNEGGYEQVPDPGALLNTKSNEGEYGFQDAHIIDQAGPESKNWKKINPYSNGSNGVLDGAEFVQSLNQPRSGIGLYNNQPYPNYNPSSYSPISILLSRDPQGSDGLLSSDSYIARLGAQTLRKEFEERIGRQIIQDTVGRANIFNVRSGTDILGLATGRVPLIQPNFKITLLANPITAAADFGLRLAGSTIPLSLIPGSYFDTSINSKQPTTIQQLNNAFKRTATGKFFTRLLGADKTGSQIMYNNMGGGQKSALFNNIDYNRYKPSFDRTLFDRLAGAVVGSTTNNSDFYVGSTTSDPSRVFSPGGDLPVNSYGQEQQSPVYGPSELAQLYEGPSQEVRLGANGPTYSNGGGIEGGFTWVSPKYKDNAGKKVGIGGLITNQDQDFKPSSYDSTESTNREYRDGSILDDTQRIIDSQPQGGRRLQHVGNAIDQVSKVFNDGYKEITKGSKVLSYVGAIGQEVGTEYCRVFAKDVPYLQYNDLQKTDGTVTENRRFSYSVLDKTYNLNMYPNKQEGGQDSSNLIGTVNNAYAKKYMFSIENLAWATSNTPGFAVSDLAVCERGPNGGRVMWFPPYDLKFSETVSANWKPNDFIGRPEPIYTYASTNRGGSLSWKIIVDHPSVLNVITNKVLSKETNKVRIDSIIESFFAGCRKYDLYELAKKYYTINPNDLFQIQQAITSKELTKEQLEYAVSTVATIPQVSQATGNNGATINWIDYENLGFYFANDVPSSSTLKFETTYTDYIGQKELYRKTSPSTKEETTSFFDTVVTPNKNELDNLLKLINQQLSNDKNTTITVTIGGTASAPAPESYNVKLSDRRIASAISYMKSNSLIANENRERFLVKTIKGGGLGETGKVEPKVYNLQQKKFDIGKKVDCRVGDPADNLAANKEIYTTAAMSCRRAYISNIETSQAPPAQPQPQKTTVVTGNVVTKTEVVPVIEEKVINKDDITKKIVRALISECDYFETIKEETPMVYDNLKEKLKFFQPAFHSTTPEGLNSRLTFLQQCMRPGDTIPTIKSVGGKDVPDYNDATNTAFGAPPVLILRVGDFYNTKIIPTSLGITYENLDLNPEGIGVQPMIANITMAFHFVGGSGLKESVDKLQNALTFNYYGNTEMWDERADTTDQSYKVIDRDFLQSIGALIQPPTINQADVNNSLSNNETIGTITGERITTNGEIGPINYTSFMDKFLTETQNYFTNTINKNREVVRQYNNGVRQLWSVQRNYTKGNFVSNSTVTEIFGKPINIEQNLNKVFEDFAKSIGETNSNQDKFITYIYDPTLNLSINTKRTIKENYLNFVKLKRGIFPNAITQVIQSTVNAEQNYLQYVSRANTIGYGALSSSQGTDGLQIPNGNTIVYDISGTDKVFDKKETNTFNEMMTDIGKIQTGLIDFNQICSVENKFLGKDGLSYDGYVFYGDTGTEYSTLMNQVFIPFSKNKTFDDKTFRREYMILSEDVIDNKKYETFKNSIIGNIINDRNNIDNSRVGDNISTLFDNYWVKIARPLFISENNLTIEFLDSMERDKLKKFMKFTPFPSKPRVLSYTPGVSANKDKQAQLIQSLGATKNTNTSTGTWNDLLGGAVAYISKVKLN
jgi:outer membrane protein OmpA-like peptidoglycan-associated protein